MVNYFYRFFVYYIYLVVKLLSKTIKELATELNVSKSYVDKIIRTLGLHTKLDKVGNKYVIDNEQEKLVKTKVLGNKSGGTTKDKSTTILDNEVDFLRKQLEDRTLEIERLQTLLDQQQQLHLNTQKLLEEKILLLETKEVEQKGFWHSLFRKKK